MKKTLQIIIAVFILNAFCLTPGHAQLPVKSWGTDVCVTSNDTFVTVKSEIAVAKNGWIYVLSVGSKAGTEQKWTIYRSIDRGITFTPICSWGYLTTDYKLQDADIEVTGDSASNIRVWVAELSNVGDVTPHESYCRLKCRDADGNSLGTPYYHSWGTNQLKSVAIASNYKNGYDFSSLNISIVWTGADPSGSGLMDVLYWAYSNDGGANFTTKPNLYVGNLATSDALGKVSVCYGETKNVTRIVAIAFEKNLNMGKGNIGVICKESTDEGNWINPVIVNLLDGSTSGNCAYPTISCMNSHDGYPASALAFPLIVAFENRITPPVIKYSILNNTFNMIGLPQATSADFSDHTGGPNTEQPNMVFDVSSNNFLFTYKDGSNNNLGFVKRNIDDPVTDNFHFVGTYRGPSKGKLTYFNPQPKVEVDLSQNKACFTWTEPQTGREDVYFDAEWSDLGVAQITGGNNGVSLFPNPVLDYINIETSIQGEYTFSLYNTMGQEVLQSRFSGTASKINLSGITPGVYMVSLVSGQNIYKGKIEVR